MLRGNIDSIDRDRMQGWVQDEAFPQATISVVISDNGKVVGKTTAGTFRENLKDAGIGDGRHAFDFTFLSRLSPDQRHIIHLRTDDGSDIPGSPAVLEPLSPAATQATGYLDLVDRHHVAGWAQYAAGSQEPASLIITVNDKFAGRIIANLHRADLKAAGIGNGRHGFDWSFPEPLSLLETHVVRVRLELDGREVPGSPVTIEPPADFDSAAQSALSALLARFERSDQIEQKIDFLANELNRLVQKKSDRDSDRFIRRRNRDLLRRWGGSGSAAIRISEEKPRALVIDDRVPALDRDAGSNAIVSHMRSLQRLGYEVSLIASAELQVSPHTPALIRGGFEIHSLPYFGSTEELLWRQAGEFELIYLHRISNASRYGELVRQHFPKARKIFAVADLHHLRLSRQAKVEDRPELLALARRLELAEVFAAASVHAVITHSDYEAAILRKHLPKANIHRVLWSIDPRPTEVPFEMRKGLAFIGGFEHAPNIDAVKWLMSELMPRIRARAPDIQCRLVGGGFPAELERMLPEGMIATGRVADLSEIFGSVRLTIAPLSYGAGVKGKIIESLAAGIPCVHTTLAGEGMGLPNELDVCRADEVGKVADIVVKLHTDAALNRHCSHAGLKYVTDELSERTLDLAMRQLVVPGPQAAPDGNSA
jgi:glycosyltransferase involved in cell wall biosynthesis